MAIKLQNGKTYVTANGQKAGPLVLCGHGKIGMFNAAIGSGVFYFDEHGVCHGAPEYNLIAEWTEEPEMPEVGTLRELNVQPGDVVELVVDPERERFTCIAAPPRNTELFGDHWEFDDVLFRDEQVRIISRAAKPLPYGHARLPSGEVVDLTTLTTPFGLLDQVYGLGTQQALRDHGGPYEAWRSNGRWEHINCGWGISQTIRVKPLPPAPKVEEVVMTGSLVNDFSGWPDEKDTHRITFTLRDGVPDPVAKVEALK